MRCFVGVKVPSELLNGLRFFGWSGRVVKGGNHHVTLVFLGEVRDWRSVSKRLESVSFPSFSVKLLGVSGFPNKVSARVLFVEVESEGLVGLRDEVVKVLGVDGGVFVPHITLMRVKKRGSFELFEQRVNKEFWVDRFCLFRSVLGRDGVVYKVLKSYGLE